MVIRFYLDQVVEYIKQPNWNEHFLNNYAHLLMPQAKDLAPFKDIDISIRFYSFHSFYHQLETTLRIVHSELKLPKGKPIERVNERIKCFPKEFIECINAVRNTIHNNGYYKPLNGQPKHLIYNNPPLNFHFTENEKLAIGTDETLFLIREIIRYTELLLRHNDVAALAFTADKN